MIAALIVFILMYTGMLVLPKYRVYFALGGAISMVLLGIIGLQQIPGAVNWNVIMMIAGTMGIVTLFIETGMPSRMADRMLGFTPNACFAIIALSVFSGIISAFVDNVATVLMVAPVGLGSVIVSAFVDNIPYVAAMLPVVKGIAYKLGIDPTVLYFGLLSGATLGGNITPFGASANVAGIGILKKEGYEVKTMDFMKIGIPFTFTAVFIGYLFIWIVWGK